MTYLILILFGCMYGITSDTNDLFCSDPGVHVYCCDFAESAINLVKVNAFNGLPLSVKCYRPGKQEFGKLIKIDRQNENSHLN